MRRVRPIAQRVLVYWAALDAGALMLGASLSVTSYLLSASRGWVDALPGGVGFLLSLVVFCMQTAGFAALYKYMPNTFCALGACLGWGSILPRAVWSWRRKGLALYLGKVPVYAPRFTAPSRLCPFFWSGFALSWVTVLMGAVVAAYAPSLLSQVKRWPDTPGQAVSDMSGCAQTLTSVQHQPQRGFSAENWRTG